MCANTVIHWYPLKHCLIAAHQIINFQRQPSKSNNREESAFLSSLRSATTDYWQAFLSPTAQQVIFLPVLGLTQANVLEQHKIGRHLQKKQ